MRRRVCRLPGIVAATVVLTCLFCGAAQARQGAAHNEAQREQWQKVEEIFTAMAVTPGAAVADVGAGDGFFTSRLSRAVGAQGRVTAVDIGADALRRLRSRVANEGLLNVAVVDGAPGDPRLPAGSLDAALIVNAYHEMAEHQAMLANIRTALKPAGRLVIVEPITASRRDARRDEQTRNHEIAVAFVLEDVRAAGFTQVAVHDPFTTRPNGHGDEWMLVVTPGSSPDDATAGAAAGAARAFSSTNEGWKAPELRITVAEFKRLDAGGDVLVLDVRDPQSYRQGHLPGAVLMTPEELSTTEGIAKLKGETRQIVAYCS